MKLLLPVLIDLFVSYQHQISNYLQIPIVVQQMLMNLFPFEIAYLALSIDYMMLAKTHLIMLLIHFQLLMMMATAAAVVVEMLTHSHPLVIFRKSYTVCTESFNTLYFLIHLTGKSMHIYRFFKNYLKYSVNKNYAYA